MKENKDITEFDSVFRQQLGNASATPPAGVWEGISSSISAGTAGTTTAIAVKTAIWVKAGIVVITAAAIASVIYVATADTKTKNAEKQDAHISTPVTGNKAESITPPITTENEVKTVTSPEKENRVIKPVIKQPVVVNAPAKGRTDQQGWGETTKDIIEFKQVQPEPITLPPAAKDTEEEVTIRTDEKKETVETPFEPKNESYKEDNRKDSSFIFIPDVVTPNGDGINDVYLIDIKGEERVRIMIFDINERKIFETTNKYAGWNCTMPNGDSYPDGSYIVKVIYKFPGLNENKKTITLKLIR